MSETSTTPNQGQDDFHLALAAMQRAAEVARQRARQHGGTLVVWRDGQIVDEPVEDEALSHGDDIPVTSRQENQPSKRATRPAIP